MCGTNTTNTTKCFHCVLILTLLVLDVLNFLSDSDNDDGSQSSHDNEQYETAKAAKHSLNDTEEFSVEQQTEKTKKGNKRVKFNLSPPIRNRMEGDSPVVISDSSKPEQGNKVVNTEHKYSVLQKRDSSLKPNLDSLQRKIRGLINRYMYMYGGYGQFVYMYMF